MAADSASIVEVVRAIRPLTALSAPRAPLPVGALTVDVEDWYQSCIDFDETISDRVVRNTSLLLESLQDSGAKATFFVQGLVAEAFPSLVRELVEAGHEVQSHAHTHRPLDRMSAAELREELVRGRAAVEDAAGVPVTAFRAPDFTIGEENLAALEVLAEVGFRVDSSIFPVRMRRYGIADSGWDRTSSSLRAARYCSKRRSPLRISVGSRSRRRRWVCPRCSRRGAPAPRPWRRRSRSPADRLLPPLRVQSTGAGRVQGAGAGAVPPCSGPRPVGVRATPQEPARDDAVRSPRRRPHRLGGRGASRAPGPRRAGLRYRSGVAPRTRARASHARASGRSGRCPSGGGAGARLGGAMTSR